jgi:hypothetical protein
MLFTRKLVAPLFSGSVQRSFVVLISVVGIATAACGSSSKSGASATSGTTAAPSPTTAYATTGFGVPFTMTLDPDVASWPKSEGANLVSWEATSFDNAVRIMVPVELFKPGSTTPQAPPQDYIGYLQGLTKDGVSIRDQKKITIGSHPASLMTVTSVPDLDGAIGCPEEGADQADGCFGPQNDTLLRLAVVSVDGKTVLLWARTPSGHPDDRFVSAFEAMLKSVQFRSA